MLAGTCRATMNWWSRRGSASTTRGMSRRNRIARTACTFLESGLADVLATESVDPIAIMDDMLKLVSSHVTVRPSGHEFFVEGRDTLLQAGLKAGLKFNYGCGNGTCGLCKARVISGDVTKVAPYDYPLSEAERLQGHMLLCVHSAASSDIVIETLEADGPRDIPEQQIAVRAAQRGAARPGHAASCTCKRRAPSDCASLPGRG